MWYETEVAWAIYCSYFWEEKNYQGILSYGYFVTLPSDKKKEEETKVWQQRKKKKSFLFGRYWFGSRLENSFLILVPLNS